MSSTTPNPIPDAVPGSVFAHAEQLNASGDLDVESVERLRRLIHDPRMAEVWAALVKCTPDSLALIHFLDIVRLHPTLARSDPYEGGRPTFVRKRIRQIEKLWIELTDRISSLREFGGIDSTQIGYFRLAMDRLTFASLTGGDEACRLDVARLGQQLEILESGLGVSHAFEVLGMAITAAADATSAARPAIVEAAGTENTSYILNLCNFLRRRFGKPFPQLVAITVNVSLNLPVSRAVKAGDVRKIAKNFELSSSAVPNSRPRRRIPAAQSGDNMPGITIAGNRNSKPKRLWRNVPGARSAAGSGQS